MARTWIWEPDRAAIARLGLLPEIAGEIKSIAGKAKRETERIAPRGPTGDYGSSIVVGNVDVQMGQAGVDFGSTDFAAHIVEFGSVNNQPYRPLHRGAQALGLRVEDTR